MEKQKNLPLLIDAFEQIHMQYPEYTLHIYGDGKEKEFLEQYILDKSLKECVFIHPAVPDIHERVIRSAMFISSSDYEGLSNSMIEAMAIGLPVICTDCPCGGARMVIEDGVNGLLVPVRNKIEMIKNIELLIRDTRLSNDLSHNATKITKHLSVQCILEKWIKVLE